MENFRTKIIVNPNSANGRTGRNWSRISEVIRGVLPEFEYEFTSAPLDATRIARESLKAGFEMIVAAGGDGTVNEVVNGFFEDGSPVSPGATLGLLPMGTGGDFRKTFGISKVLEESVPVLEGRESIVCDAGRIVMTGHDGNVIERYFINIASFGMGGLVDRLVNQTSKAFGGFVSFFWGMLRAGMVYRNQPVSLTIDGVDLGTRVIKNVVIANGRYFGGGMRVAKNADPSDGEFDVIIMGDFTFIEGLKLVRSIYSGDIINYTRKVEYLRARELKAVSDSEVLIDMDGEQPGKLPVEINILPGAMRVKAPPGCASPSA